MLAIASIFYKQIKKKILIGVKNDVENIRVACLLVVLLIVAVNAYRDQNQDWNQPINFFYIRLTQMVLPSTQKYIQNCSWMISMK